jgi:hypothetical protein
MKNAYKIVVAKAERKRPLGRPTHRWEDSIKTNLKEVLWKSVDCILLAQDSDQWRALVTTTMNLQVP